MNTIILNDLIFSGVHGHTAKEKNKPQRFKVDITVTSKQVVRRDYIAETVDYRFIKEAARKIIEERKYELIETIANQIADLVVAMNGVKTVEVRISKLDIWEQGKPNVVVTKKSLPKTFDLLDFDFERVLKDLVQYGASSVAILPKERRMALVAEAESYTYIKQPEMAESPLVREQLSSCMTFLENGLFFKLKNDFIQLLNEKITMFDAHQMFKTPLALSEMSLQLYEKGSLGITPHRDGKSRINIICVFILKGRATYALCDNRAGENQVYLDSSPGNVIFMRGPGFLGSEYQPFHTVKDITEERIVFGLRQRATSIK